MENHINQHIKLNTNVYSVYFKRPLDILIAVAGLIVLSPFFVLVSLVILLANGRPILFLQPRIGRNGKKFRMCKFRTMTVVQNQNPSDFDAGQTARITRVGRWLRRSKLDEMPQLLNVLAGQMSIVGPRPEVDKWTKIYTDKWAFVHTIRPGITDWAAIEFRHEEVILATAVDAELTYKEEVLPKKLSRYLDYVADISFLNDLKILLSTVSIIFSRN